MMMQTYYMEYDKSDLEKAIKLGFLYLESRDEIVGTIYVAPAMAKDIVLRMPGEVTFDYIPEGIGMLRTAYLKYLPSARNNEIIFINQNNTVELKLHLI